MLALTIFLIVALMWIRIHTNAHTYLYTHTQASTNWHFPMLLLAQIRIRYDVSNRLKSGTISSNISNFIRGISLRSINASKILHESWTFLSFRRQNYLKIFKDKTKQLSKSTPESFPSSVF